MTDLDFDFVKRLTSKILKIQKDYGVEVLFVAEAGSRAWGYASEDSDHDVRFIYVRPVSDYVSITDRQQTITRAYPEENVEIVGWDLKKVLSLSIKGNATVLEWFNSPMVYLDQIGEECMSFVRLQMNPLTSWHHYAGIARNNYKSYIQERSEVSVKKYVHVSKSALCAAYIEKYRKTPPVKIHSLIESGLVDSRIEFMIRHLVSLKIHGVESIQRLDSLDSFIHLAAFSPQDAAEKIGKSKSNNQKSVVEANKILLHHSMSVSSAKISSETN